MTIDENDKLRSGSLPQKPTEGTSVAVDAPVVRSVRYCIGKQIEAMMADQRETIISTGFAAVDNRTGGLQRGDVTIVGGRTSTGKSTFTIGMVDDCLRRGHGALIVSLEDSERLYGKRLLARRTGIASNQLRRMAGLSAEDRQKIQDVYGSAERSPVYMNARGKTVEAIANMIPGIIAENSIRLLVVDYAQKLTTAKRCPNRKEELEHAAHYLSDVAKNLNVVTILVSQLTRNDDDKPGVGDLRDCKTLGNAAENVLLLWKFEAPRDVHLLGNMNIGDVCLVSAKLKDGECGVDRLGWDRELATFYDPDGVQQYGEWGDAL